MTRKRKNAGEGYGYMFSGAFAKKSDAVKKEKQRKGSFVKAVMMRHGMRYAVMTPRLNPIKRKKNPARPFIGPDGKVWHSGKQPSDKISLKEFRKMLRAHGYGAAAAVRGATREQAEEMIRQLDETHARHTSQNPSELLVLGANPSGNRELNLPAGSTITIRVNPASAAICGAMIGGEPCSRQPGHRGPHLPQGATMRPRSRLRSGWKPRAANPSAAAIRESFTGTAADKISIRTEPHMPPGDYAQLGELLALYVKPQAGGQVQQISFSRPRPLIVSDESARQIYFVGGDQDLGNSLGNFSSQQRGGLLILGVARRIDYKQRKEHVATPDADEWRHDFGEESGIQPTVLYDRHHKRILLEGGEYVIRPEGIVN